MSKMFAPVKHLLTFKCFWVKPEPTKGDQISGAAV